MSTVRTAFILTAAFCGSTTWAQQVDAFMGLGSARVGSNGQSIDTFGDGTLYKAPAMGGVFTDFGFNLFLNRQVGIGWTIAWTAAHDYAGLQYRPKFNTFDAVFQPTLFRTKLFLPELRAGIGFASINFDYDDPQACAQVPGCPSSHHFVGHAAVATRLYLTHHVFLRPSVDAQYVKHFFLFGSNWVPRYSMSFGYSFGKE